MKKLKLLVFILAIFLLTGCEVNYNLTITKDLITESVDFIYDNTVDNQIIVDSYYKSDYSSYFNMDNRKDYYYEKEKLETTDKIGIRLSYSFSEANYQKSSLLNRCYYKKSLIKNEEYIILTTDGITTCFYKDQEKMIDKLAINIITKLEVAEHNADKIDGNKYSWYIDETNFKNHPINIKLIIPEEKKGFEFTEGIKIAIIVLIGILIVVAAFLTYVFVQKRKNNKL